MNTGTWDVTHTRVDCYIWVRGFHNGGPDLVFPMAPSNDVEVYFITQSPDFGKDLWARGPSRDENAVAQKLNTVVVRDRYGF